MNRIKLNISYSFRMFLLFSFLGVGIFLFKNYEKLPPDSYTKFENSDIKGRIIFFDHGAGSYYIISSDHPDTEFSFSVLPDGDRSRLSSIIVEGDSIIKKKNSSFLMIKKSEGSEHVYELNRWFTE